MNEAALNVRTVQRQLAALLPEARMAATGLPSLEVATQGTDAPRLISATMLEEGPLRARAVANPNTMVFRAFLDGTQRSERIGVLGFVPIILGRTAAVIRERRDRRMYTWGTPSMETRIYAPQALLASQVWSALESVFGELLVDTSSPAAELGSHPFALRDAAVHQVQKRREQLELRLAEQWCASERDPLFVDGGISGSKSEADSGCTVGVVKSHLTLYAEGEALAVVLNLGANERSSVFRVTSKRTAVASWYLRLREPVGNDPMWGLIRVEIADPGADLLARIGDRADEVSRWILAEASPLSLPDGRWDKMVYGIRDCEEYLRSVS